MELVVLAGAHATGFVLLQKCIKLNLRHFQRNGVVVSDYENYKNYLLEALEQRLAYGEVAEFDKTQVLGKTQNSDVEFRTVISSESLFGIPRLAARGARLYQRASQRVGALAQLLPDANIEFIVVIRNPATFLPALFESTSAKSFSSFVAGADPRVFRWSDMFSELTSTFPAFHFSVYCYEDLPLTWGELLRTIGSLEPTSQIRGEFAFANELMENEGKRGMADFMKAHPEMSELQKRRVAAAFLEKYIKAEKLEQVIDIPNWAEDLIEELSELYEDDLENLSRLPNVTITSA